MDVIDLSENEEAYFFMALDAKFNNDMKKITNRSTRDNVRFFLLPVTDTSMGAMSYDGKHYALITSYWETSQERLMILYHDSRKWRLCDLLTIETGLYNVQPATDLVLRLRVKKIQ